MTDDQNSPAAKKPADLAVSQHAVLELARQLAESEDGTIMTSTGFRIRVRPVANSVITETMQKVEKPVVPNVYNELKGREEPNPHSAEYVRAVEAYNLRVASAMNDAIAMMGVDLVDPIPDDNWEKRLEMLGIIPNAAELAADPLAREFAFKRYVAIAAEDFELVSARARLRRADVERARRNFTSAATANP